MSFGGFSPDVLRAAVFTPSLSQLQVAHVAGQLLHQLPQFTGDPVIIPVPADAPPQIPRIVLSDSTGTMRFQIAASRSDLYLNRQPGGSVKIEGFFGQATDMLEVLLGALGVRPGRLAALGTFFRRSSSPERELAAHFCKPEWVHEGGALAEVRAFELHAHRRFELMEGLVVNSWVRCKSGLVIEAAAPFPAIVLERDVNTLDEEADARRFDPGELREFMGEAGLKLGEEIPRFFPEGS